MRGIIAGISLLLVVTNTMADTEPSYRSSKTIGYINTTQDQLTDSSLNYKLLDKHPALLVEGYREEAGPIKTESIQVRRHSECNCDPHDFTISGAWVSLQADADLDGYYRRFKLMFDADVYSGNAQVYADIYLSYEGGPWNLLYTTNRFNLAGSSTQDEYVVETELDSGYPAGYYDVLIELYDANSNRFLLDYGPYQNAELSSLPMEDRYHDLTDYHGDSYGFYGSGTLSWMILLLLSSLRLLKKHP